MHAKAAFCCSLLVLFGPVTLLAAGEPEAPRPLLTVSANRFTKDFELVTLDIQGENAKLELPIRGEATDPCWSPDGRKLVYRTGRYGPLQVCQFDVDTSEETNLTKTAVNEHQPVFSPDGKRILFTSQRTGRHQIFVMNANGSNPLNLTNHNSFNADPSWSPDGKQIVFVSLRSRAGRLYVMDADGSNVRQLVDHNVVGWIAPSWTADGKQILFSSGDGRGASQVYVVNADGKGQQTLTEGPGFNAMAAYSPDERFIAYVRFDRPINDAVEGGTLMLYDLDALTHTPIAPGGMRCGRSKLVWKPQRGK